VKRSLSILTFGTALVAALALVAFGWLVWQVDRLGRRDDARPSDVIVVLGARVLPDGSPGPDLTSRTQHAIDLWQKGLAPYIICSGGYKNERLSAAAVCKRYAAVHGVPGNDIWLADGSQNTIEDARSTAEVMAERGWRSAILVSHPLHLYRALWLFRQAGVDAVTSPTSTQTERISLPYRTWYALREAGAIIVTNLNARGCLPPQWTTRLQTISYNLP
jgi:uncharacterized SAM-binding protein YcdF (DUF218 family)